MKTLTEIANQYHTDKNTVFPLHHRHGYSEIYPQFLERLRHSPITLLEIGVVLEPPGGESIHMWEEYFSHPECQIIALDILPISHLEGPRTRTIQGNVCALDTLAHLPEKMDVIIDDGSHIAEEQISALRNLWPRLNDGGIYVIEDLSIPDIPNSCRIENAKTRVAISCLDGVEVHWFSDCYNQFAIAFLRKLCLERSN
jgi:hypothetical protein